MFLLLSSLIAMKACKMETEELNLAASPALRRLFGRVIDAVGSAVAGNQEPLRLAISCV